MTTSMMQNQNTTGVVVETEVVGTIGVVREGNLTSEDILNLKGLAAQLRNQLRSLNPGKLRDDLKGQIKFIERTIKAAESETVLIETATDSAWAGDEKVVADANAGFEQPSQEEVDRLMQEQAALDQIHPDMDSRIVSQPYFPQQYPGCQGDNVPQVVETV